jgi:hypothetical protein
VQCETLPSLILELLPFVHFCAPCLGGWLNLPLSVCMSVRPFSFVSHVTQKIFDLESWNLTGMLISMCSCAPGYFSVDLFSTFREKNCNFQLVSHVTQKGIDLESWNFTGILISICSCAPGSFHVDLYSIFLVIALDLDFLCNFQLVSHVTQKGFVIESWNLTGICSACVVVHLGFRLWIYQVFVELLPLT